MSNTANLDAQLNNMILSGQILQAFDKFYADWGEIRTAGLQCLKRGYARPGPISCRILVWPTDPDLRAAVGVAKKRPVHFTRLILAREPPGRGFRPGPLTSGD